MWKAELLFLKTIHNRQLQIWFTQVDNEDKLFSVRMDGEQRSSHLPQLFRDLICRLSKPLALVSYALIDC
jgi:hypothetical protein